MDQGNEGDAIIFLALRQIDCSFPDDINGIGELTADMIVEIVAKSLFLISDSEIKVSSVPHFFLIFMCFTKRRLSD
jgi:hypothetical protein